MRGRLTSSHFVGRLGELAELELAYREAAGAHPRIVLLGGESGVGKTRLVAEFLSRADDALALRGECLEQGDGELPYAPLLGALRPLVRAQNAALKRLSPSSRSQLATLLPSLGDAAAASGSGTEPADQLRLFEALLELLELLSEEQPVVLVLEDMHWADRSTRAFTAFFSRAVREERMLVLLTYRSDELHRRHALRPLLTELDRLDCTRRIELEPFDRAELAEAMADILGRAPDDALVERLFTRSEGNPLYTEELLAAGLDGRGAAPQSLHDAFLLRIERLSDGAQRAVRALAVGRRLDEGTLGAVCAAGAEELHAALREAVAEQVLVVDDDGRFRFRHALLAETLYDDLLPGERVELHLALARALEQSCESDPDADVERVATVAAHYAAAGEQSAALRAMLAAARAAQRVHAWGEVAETTERALELWPRVSNPEDVAGLDHVELLALAARGHRLGGDRERGAMLLDHAIEELDHEAEPLRAGDLLARYARLLWSLNRAPEALAAADRARELLAERDDSVEWAWLLAWLARTRVLRGKYVDALEQGDAALRAAAAAGDPRIEGEVLNTLGMANIALGDVETGEAQLRQAIALARQYEDLDEVSTGYSNLADLLSLRGRTADALEVAREGFGAVPRRLSRARDWMSLSLAMAAFEGGDWATARARVAEAPKQARGMLLIFSRICQAELALADGDHDAARAALATAEPLVRVSNEAQWHGGFGSLLGELRRREGDLDGARAAVQAALDELEVCTDDVMRIARVSAVGMAVEADRALRARDLREPGDRRDALAWARIHLDRLKAAAHAGGPVERAWAEVGAAEMTRARGKSDPRRWRCAAEAWDAVQRPYPAATARWREVEALVEAGDRETAGEVARAALAVCERLGARWLGGELQALVARARLQAGEPDALSAAENGNSPADPFGLTPRERQVLALVAAGATNRQIGASLFMAEKTASVHVSRILAKLGVQTRTQAAAVAHRLHLA